MPPTALAMASTARPITGAAAAPVAKTDLSAIQPQYRDSSVAKDDNLPGEAQILDRWKDSGKPLR